VTKRWSPDEDARQPDYRRLYQRILELEDIVSALYETTMKLKDEVRELKGRGDDGRVWGLRRLWRVPVVRRQGISQGRQNVRRLQRHG